MHIQQSNNFLFASRYRVWRHGTFFLFQTLFFTLVFIQSTGFLKGLLFNGSGLFVWLLYCYPLMYWILPNYLLKARYWQFVMMFSLWIIGGCFWILLYRTLILIPLQEAVHFKNTIKSSWVPGNFLAMTTTAGFASMIVLFKYWMKKQQAWLQAEKEKVTAELQLLKAQVHPHFLFNTLNNIYSFSLENSPKTPALLLKLSSLLSYMLYDCKAEQVLLAKEIEVMKDYVDLEKERYGNRLEISWNIEGEVEDKNVVPLLLLPFLENAFKHGTSDQLEKPWLSFDLVVKNNSMKCKVVNSKNELVSVSHQGIGVENVKRRLHLLYPGKHELKMNDEGDFFVVSLLLELINIKEEQATISDVLKPIVEKAAL